MTAAQALAEFEQRIEMQSRMVGIHYALLIYTLEQLGFEDIFQQCFSYVGGNLFLWDIYRKEPIKLADFLIETFNTLPWPFRLDVGEETWEAVKKEFPVKVRGDKFVHEHINPFGLNIACTPGIPPGEIHFMQVIREGETHRLSVARIVNVEMPK